MLELHFFESIQYLDDQIQYLRLFDGDWAETADKFERCKYALEQKRGDFNHKVYTLQMSFLTQAWDWHFEYGARVFIHDHTGTYEVLEEDKCHRTNRYLRRAHNLFKLWKAGEFWNEKEKENADN